MVAEAKPREETHPGSSLFHYPRVSSALFPNQLALGHPTPSSASGQQTFHSFLLAHWEEVLGKGSRVEPHMDLSFKSGSASWLDHISDSRSSRAESSATCVARVSKLSTDPSSQTPPPCYVTSILLGCEDF